ncbi:LacI family DNA-binding transcriptional regulator [Mycoplasmatota bacterium WC30]
MSTMKDIAKLANVSYGTASNVLNKRGNVSLVKIKAVEDAANKLGYYINSNASELRSNKKEDIAFIVPTIDNCFYRKLYNLLRKRCNLDNIKLNLYITEYSNELEIEYAKLATRNNEYIILHSCLDTIKNIYDSTLFDDSIIIFLNSAENLKKQNLYSVKFDISQMNNEIKQYCDNNNITNALFFSDFDIQLSEELSELVDYKQCNHPYNLSFALDSLTRNSYDLIIVTSIEKYKDITRVKDILQITKPIKTITITDDNVLICEDAIIYKQDINILFNKISTIINKENTNNLICIPYDGFSAAELQVNTVEFINLLMIESPATSAFLKIKPYIEKKLGFSVNIDVIKYNQYDTVIDENIIKKYDLIRIDMAYLPSIAKKIFKPLDSSTSLIKKKFIDNLDEYIYHDDTIYSLPFDIGCQILMYRDDIINNQIMRRTYYEATKQNEILPKNYEQYNLLESFFKNNFKNKYHGSTVCTGARVTCGNEFINRAPYQKILKNDVLNINEPEIKKALDSYLFSVKQSRNENFFWDDVVKEYSVGETVVSIVFSNYIHLLKEYNQTILYKTGYSLPPNNKSIIGGGVIGFSKYTKKEALCYEFFKTIYSNQISELLVHLGVAIPTKAIFSNINLISMYPWLSLIPDVLKDNTRKYYSNNGKLLPSLEFEKQIGQAVKKYITDQFKNTTRKTRK